MTTVEEREFHVRPVRGVAFVLAAMGLYVVLLGVTGFGNVVGTLPGVAALLIAGYLGFRANQRLS